MITFRRRLLDKALEQAVPLMCGRVLDIGGKKENKRGRFRPPLEKVESWKYLNPDKSTNPDYCCSAESIPLADNSIDTVVMTEVLEYLPNIDRVLDEIFRVLPPGGICLISAPCLVPIHGDYWSDRQRFTSLGLKELLEKAGFLPPRIEPLGSLGAVFNDILHAASSYAREEGKNLFYRVLRLLLRILSPLFRLTDLLTPAQKKYITTGYFLTAKKPDRS